MSLARNPTGMTDGPHAELMAEWDAATLYDPVPDTHIGVTDGGVCTIMDERRGYNYAWIQSDTWVELGE